MQLSKQNLDIKTYLEMTLKHNLLVPQSPKLTG